MELLLPVVSGFLLAIFAPALYRLLGNRTGLLLALLPAGLFAYFARYLGHFPDAGAIVEQYQWAPSLGLSLTLYLDGLGLLFALLITGVGALVLIYTSGYFHDDKYLGRFYASILAFMASMLGLVLSGNLLVIYVFWEFTTVTSYLLIGYEHEREAARAAALTSLMVTGMGSLAMLAGLILLGLSAGTFQIAELLQQGDLVRSDPRYVGMLLLILLGAFTKSAQFPFHFWLPAAMEAPTPVSAYLHSATMVKAGIFLLARLSPVLGHTETWYVVVTSVGAVTMLTGAWVALFKTDLKGILAYLTVCVLGVLTMLLGIGTELAVKGAMIYLFAHAMYKGAMFLLAGGVGHETGTRDIRELSGLRHQMPLTAVLVGLAALSMAGIAPLLGFTAKEVFLEAVGEAPRGALLLTGVVVVGSIFMTVGAAMIGIIPFFGPRRAEHAQVHEVPVSMWISPLLLAGGGVLIGMFPQPLASPLIEPAVAGIYQQHIPIKFSLWHGFTLPLALSLLILVGGVVLYLAKDRLWQAARPWQGISAWGPTAGFEFSMRCMNWVARWQTRLLQNGYLRTYILIAVATMLASVTVALYRMEWSLVPRYSVGMRAHEGMSIVLIVLAAISAARARSRFQAIASLGVIGFNVAWIFLLFGAPDLAMTQFVIESLLILIFVFAFFKLPELEIRTPWPTRVRDALLSIGAGAIVTVLLLMVGSMPRMRPISHYFVEKSYTEAHGRNVVNVILVDFRALDTMGEITVLTAAALGVFVLVKLVVSQGKSQ